MTRLPNQTVYADIENLTRTRLKSSVTTRDVVIIDGKPHITIGYSDIPVSQHGDGYKVDYPLGASFNILF